MTRGMHNEVYYLAAPFTEKWMMEQYRQLLQDAGARVNASWIDEVAASDAAVSDDYLEQAALVDLKDVSECTTFVCFPGKGAGHHTELGLALAGGKRVVIVGRKNNVFHYLPLLEWHKDFPTFMATELGRR